MPQNKKLRNISHIQNGTKRAIIFSEYGAKGAGPKNFTLGGSTMIRQFLREEEALTTVEYGIMLAALTVLVVAAIFALFGNVGKVFSSWAQWQGWSSSPPAPSSGG
jgi:Flp pilus assembly pilin Flp